MRGQFLKMTTGAPFSGMKTESRARTAGQIDNIGLSCPKKKENKRAFKSAKKNGRVNNLANGYAILIFTRNVIWEHNIGGKHHRANDLLLGDMMARVQKTEGDKKRTQKKNCGLLNLSGDPNS